MLIISGSLPKSASTWLFNVTDALLVAAGHLDAQSLRRRSGLEEVLTSAACEISYATPAKLLRILPVSLRGHAVLAKTHEPPSRSLRLLLHAGLASATYIWRDPRDVALSAFDHGRRAREGGHAHHLGRLATVEAAIRHTRQLLERQWSPWIRCPHVLHLRYEHTTANPLDAAGQIASHLRLSLDRSELQAVVAPFHKSTLSDDDRQRMLIHKARANRYQQEMSPAQRRLADDLLGPYLEPMGYAA